MPGSAVVLYGPPAVGKDTITTVLTRVDQRYLLFDKLKAGDGRTAGYRATSDAEIARLRDAGLLLYANTRYGNQYAVDRPHLDAILAAGRIPILHMGQTAGVRAVLDYPARWLTVLLWCSRDTTARRTADRGSTDIDARLRAWDETRTDLTEHPATFEMRIDTDHSDPESAAQLIHAAAIRPAGEADPTHGRGA